MATSGRFSRLVSQTRRRRWQPVPAPRRPVLFVNPRSGGGSAERERIAERARERGIRALGIAGGDGSRRDPTGSRPGPAFDLQFLRGRATISPLTSGFAAATSSAAGIPRREAAHADRDGECGEDGHDRTRVPEHRGRPGTRAHRARGRDRLEQSLCDWDTQARRASGTRWRPTRNHRHRRARGGTRPRLRLDRARSRGSGPRTGSRGSRRRGGRPRPTSALRGQAGGASRSDLAGPRRRSAVTAIGAMAAPTREPTITSPG